MELTPVLPPTNAKIDFDILECAVNGPEISVVDDDELKPNGPVGVIELIGLKSQVTFFPECSRQYLVINFKNIQRFLAFSLVCSDDTQKEKTFEMSNNHSIVSIDGNYCKMPLETEP